MFFFSIVHNSNTLRIAGIMNLRQVIKCVRFISFEYLLHHCKQNKMCGSQIINQCVPIQIPYFLVPIFSFCLFFLEALIEFIKSFYFSYDVVKQWLRAGSSYVRIITCTICSSGQNVLMFMPRGGQVDLNMHKVGISVHFSMLSIWKRMVLGEQDVLQHVNYTMCVCVCIGS